MTASSIPAKQTAAVLRGAYGERHVVDKQYPVSHPGLGDALIQMEAAGICHGDVNPRDGYPPAPSEPVRPLVTGHEGIGHIIALGEADSEFKVGDRVGMGWRRSTCHSCEPCRKGEENLCQKQIINGYAKDGTFQGRRAAHHPASMTTSPLKHSCKEYLTIPTSDLVHIPTSSAQAFELAPLLCAGGTALGGVRSAGVLAGDWMCITGAAGGVGSLAVQYAKHLGYKVVAIDSKKKEEYCKSIGADRFIDFEDTDTVVKRITDATDGGVQGTVVCSANPASYSQAVEYSGVGATIVSIGPSMIHLHTGHLMMKGLKLVAQSNGTKKDIEDAIALAKKGIVPQVQIVPLESLDEALDRLKLGQVVGRQAVVFR
ncbi:hypothetical protein LTS15_009688 [Exophiala xenobiotica]|nr:hypothetical protein LTS15_009688 [Exophiala xenobiotica]